MLITELYHLFPVVLIPYANKNYYELYHSILGANTSYSELQCGQA